MKIGGHWAKILDRLLPFMLNLASGESVARVIGNTFMGRIDQPVGFVLASEIHAWILQIIDVAVAEKWLIDR